jgi:hypothetical protein
MLATAGVLSFRSIPRVLRIFMKANWIPSSRVPHFTSIINWTVRAGISVYRRVSVVREPWVAIVDSSIDIGIRKALVVLRISMSALQRLDGAVGLRDCECVGIKVSTSWNGESVHRELAAVFERTGEPLAILKDQGTDLAKGVRLYCNGRDEAPIPEIDDVGHVAANALKADFSRCTDFRAFLETTKIGSAKIRQTTIAHLLPPKVRSKGRFQSITRLARWAGNILSLLSASSPRMAEEQLRRLRDAFGGFLPIRDFLRQFVEIGANVETFLQLMKQDGLSPESYTKAAALLQRLPERFEVRGRLDQWLNRHFAIHRSLALGSQKLPVSDDVIESLFGHFKVAVQRSPQGELNRLVYLMPLLCGNHPLDQIEKEIQMCTQDEMVRYIAQNLPPTLRQQRCKAFEVSQ